MGPVNWIAVIVAAIVATALGAVWQARTTRPTPQSIALVLAGMLLSATMIGHNFARVGPETLHAKPWLYFMMSGGLALAFVAPALYIGLARYGVSRADRARDCGYWIAAYLAMGAVFWGLS